MFMSEGEWTTMEFSHYVQCNRPFPSYPGPLYQNEVDRSAFDMEMFFHSHANKNHFHKKGCALGLILKVRVFGTRKVAYCIKLSGHAFQNSFESGVSNHKKAVTSGIIQEP